MCDSPAASGETERTVSLFRPRLGLRVVVADMQSYDVFYKKLISAVPLKNVTSRFAMEKIKSVTALPVPPA